MNRKLFIVSFVLIAALLASVSVFGGGSRETAPGEVVITWPTHWVGEMGAGPIIRELVDEFNALHAGEIRVVLEAHPEADAAEDVIRTRLAAGQPPDFFLFKLGPTTEVYYETGLLMDLTDELERDGWGATFDPGALAVSTINGEVRSLPIETALTPIWYNTRLFEEAGIDEFPTTIDEFWEAADRLLEIGVVPTSQMTGGANAWTSMLWYTHLVGSIGGPDVWDRAWDDPAFEEAAGIMKRMYQEYTTRDAIGAGPGESSAHFMNERTAMFVNGPWFVSNIRDNAPDVHAVTRLAPAPSAGDYHGHQVGWLLTSAAAAHTDDPARRDAVVQWFRFLTHPDNIKRQSLGRGSLMPVAFEIGPEDNVDPLQQQFIEAGNNATFLIDGIEAVMPVHVVQEFGQALSAMVLRDLPPSEFVALMRAAAE
ncbi:MAG: carbohydrate ABC transporter substrate-binding protein [Spirochaetaceae bacterium]|nr:MAG: carbohydrate ABC transporter substrate-binding protein [Spirochaetaceae bacterium]